MSFIVKYSDEEYDIENFLDLHPAGKKIILPYKDKDITEAFTNIGHSQTAIKILNKYKISGNNSKSMNNISNKNADSISVKKLFTKEDRYNFHKIFGLLSLCSFTYRYLYVLPTTGTLGFNGSYFDLATLFSHFILSSSSLIFHVLEKRIVERPLIIYEEYRLHAILFSMRAIIITLLGMYTTSYEPYIRKILIVSILICTHLCVDYVTHKYGTHGVTAVRNNNDGKNNLKYIGLFYSYYQICALGSHIILDKYLCDLGYNSLIAIQSSAFLMTLKRKSIIRWKSHAFWYSFALFLSYCVMYLEKGYVFFIQMAVVFFMRVNFNINKYALWGLYASIYYYLE